MRHESVRPQLSLYFWLLRRHLFKPSTSRESSMTAAASIRQESSLIGTNPQLSAFFRTRLHISLRPTIPVPTVSAVGHFFRKCACLRGFLEVLAGFDLLGAPRKTPVFTLSGPFFSPAPLSRSGAKSAKGLFQPITNKQLTRGRIKRLFFGIGKRRKPPRFGEWKMHIDVPEKVLVKCRNDEAGYKKHQ